MEGYRYRWGIYMDGREFIDKILAGERDLRGIILRKGNLLKEEGYEYLIKYLEGQDLENEPLIFCASSWDQEMQYDENCNAPETDRTGLFWHWT